jgi:hypothetical protein
MSHFRLPALILLIVLAFALSACEQGSAPGASTAAPVPSPAGASLPTSHSSSAASGETVADLRAALNRTKDAGAYRMALEFTIGTSDGGAAPKEQPFLKFSGDVNGAANHVIYTGGIFNDLLGGGDRIETVTLEGKTYLTGSSLFGTADPGKWYVLSESALSKPPFNLGDMLLQSGDDVGSARLVSTDSLDGETCETWQVDFQSGAGALIDIAATDETRAYFKTLDSAESRLTRCPDNYVHKLTWSIRAHNDQNAGQQGTVQVAIHLFDFDASTIAISAPPDAIELR